METKCPPTPRRRTVVRRSGSALIVVLGLLAVMMVLGVAFSNFARTEHSGSTNLKNGLVARQALNTAVGRVMEAIDLSFGSPMNNWPVAIWPNPWLASSSAVDYYQSKALEDGQVADAHILTAEIAQYLTPSQRALAKTAACDWAPIYAAVESEGPISVKPGTALYGNKGRDDADSVIGRYAFIAFDTTGLLDVNAAGSANGTAEYSGQTDRDENSGEYPFTYILPDKGDRDNPDEGDLAVHTFRRSSGSASTTTDVVINHVLKNRADFLSRREKAEGRYDYPQITSFADLRNIVGDALDYSLPSKDDVSGATTAAALSAHPFPADLFSTFSASLEDLDPEGLPKVALPRNASEIGGMNQSAARSFGSRALQAMVKVFANARADTSLAMNERRRLSPSSNKGDQYKIFEGTGKAYNLTRARLATVAMIDAMDADFLPGEWKGKNFIAWQHLPDLEGSKTVECQVVMADGSEQTATVEDSLSALGTDVRNEPLNFPCTEPVPMLSSVFAYIDMDDEPLKITGFTENANKKSRSYITLKGCMRLAAVAALQNESTNKASRSYTVKVTCDMLSAIPTAGTVSGHSTSENVAERIWEDVDNPHREWICDDFEDFYPANGYATVTFEKTGSVTDQAGGSANSRRIVAETDVDFEIRCYAADWPGNSGDPPDCNTITYSGAPGYEFWPMTQAEEDDDKKDLILPFRFKVEIVDNKENKTVVQRVPAPAIDDGRKYWVRVDAGLYHPKGTDLLEGKTASDEPDDPTKRDYSVGWALCADPVFAFDTSSLRTDQKDDAFGNESFSVWINDRVAFTLMDENPVIENLQIEMADPGNAVDHLYGDKNKGDWNYLQTDVLFSKDSIKNKNDVNDNKAPMIRDWMMIEGTMAPDLLHSASRKGAPFCFRNGNFNSQMVGKQLPSHIQNAPFTSVGQLGNVRIGPYETLATVRAYRFASGGVSDFHRVLDYFTVADNRSPKNNASSGSDSAPLFSAFHRGRVNLNMPPLLRWNSDEAKRATFLKDQVPRNGSQEEVLVLNPYPAIAALTGASISSGSTLNQEIDFDLAAEIVQSFAESAGETIVNDVGFKSAGQEPERDVFRRLSDLGWAELNGENPILASIVRNLGSSSDLDADRESFIGNAANAFTTRGQTYLVIIRADAYTPRYGEEQSTSEGTTLATTHAVLELFRDPEYARCPDGSPLKDKNNKPVYFHNWFIKSFRIL